MSSNPKRYYWDSSVFCSFFGKEANRYDVVLDLLNEAKAKKLEIVTSSFTLTEVLKLKSYTPLSEKEEGLLTAFFEYDFIKIVNADRPVCERARYYVWKHKLSPKDAVHAATAEYADKSAPIDELFSWDDDFVKRSLQTPIKFPFNYPYVSQLNLRLQDAQPEEATEDESAPEPDAET